MGGVAGLEPAASWSRRFGSDFKKHFPARSMLFVRKAIAFQTSALQCLHPLPAQSGSAFGSKIVVRVEQDSESSRMPEKLRFTASSH